MSTAVHQAFAQLIGTTERILELDFEDEQSIERLEELQAQQDDLRESIDGMGVPADANDELLRSLIRKAYDSELQVNAKLHAARNEASFQIGKLQSGNRMKNAYSQEYSQSEGYFVDRKK